MTAYVTVDVRALLSAVDDRRRAQARHAALGTLTTACQLLAAQVRGLELLRAAGCSVPARVLHGLHRHRLMLHTVGLSTAPRVVDLTAVDLLLTPADHG